MAHECDYARSGMRAVILPGAAAELRRRKWDRCDNPNRDGQAGVVDFDYGANTADEHVAVSFEDGGGSIGFPPEYVRIG